MTDRPRRRAGVLLFALIFGGACAPRPPPNVILIVIDTLRADHLGQYGYPRATSPALDRLRRHATLFTRAYATAPWTIPSVASLFTGLSTARHLLNRTGLRIGEDARTLAEILRDAGWHTAGVSHNLHIAEKTGFGQGFDRFESGAESALDYPDVSDLVASTLRWLDGRPPRPFFLYLQPMNVHGPYKVPAEHAATLLGRPPRPGFVYRGPTMLGILERRRLELRRAFPPARLESLMEQYDNSVRYTTDQVGRILQEIERAGLYDDSLIIVTADHGEELFEHGGFGHGYSLHREVLQVPLYIKLPGQRSPRLVTDRVSLIDVLPTVLDVAGLAPLADLDGTSLRLLLEGAQPPAVPRRQRTLLHETAWKGRCTARAIVSGRYKLIEIEENYEGVRDALRLYDLEADPQETRNIAARHPELVAELRQRLRQGFESDARAALQEPASVLEQMDRDRLEALGYLDGPASAETGEARGTPP